MMETLTQIVRKARTAAQAVRRAETDSAYKLDNPFGYRQTVKEAKRKAQTQYDRLAIRGYNPEGASISSRHRKWRFYAEGYRIVTVQHKAYSYKTRRGIVHVPAHTEKRKMRTHRP